MSNTVFCCKLNREAEALSNPPFPNELGLEILKNVSKEAWSMWLSHQTMLINEYRLNVLDPQSKQFLQDELKKYFFGSGSEKPTGYSPE